MKVLFVVEPGSAPSTRLRLTDCLEHYRAGGLEPTLLAPPSTWAARWQVIREAGRHEVVVLFKSTGFTQLQLALLRRANRRIIFDYDDAIMFRDQKYERPLRARTFAKYLRTLEHCAAVVAGNSFLGCFAEASGQRTIVLPTPIDLPKYRWHEPTSALRHCVGWLGLSDGFRYLQDIAPAFRQLAARYPEFHLKIVSDQMLHMEGVRIENERWCLETEQENLASFDVGIMPLWDSAWTRGKCSYKIVQYMGVGTPVVASAVGMNREVIAHGENGFLARTEDDWVGGIAGLFDDAQRRRNFALRGRETVERSFSLAQYAQRYLAFIREVAAS